MSTRRGTSLEAFSRRHFLLGIATTSSVIMSDQNKNIASAATSSPDPVIFDALPQFYTVDDVPKAFFDDRRYIYAFVERVIDGDTIRVRHIPGYGFGRANPEPLKQRGIANETLSVRVYAVDCPETGKNKRKTSQPFGDEAEAFTRDLVGHKMVKITFLRRDQYRRAVAQVETLGGVFEQNKDLSMELAKAGLAELYTGGGAEYFGRRDELEQAIQQAQRQKRGIWSLGDDRVSAAEYKRAQRDGAPVAKGRSNKNKEKSPLLAASVYGDVVTADRERGARIPFAFRKRKNGLASSVMDVAVTGLELTLGA